MSHVEEVRVPDIGDFDEVDVVEVVVSVGDEVEVDDALIVLESDKASMEVPSPFAGAVRDVRVAVGDKVGEGAVIARIEASVDGAAGETESEPAEADAASGGARAADSEEKTQSEPAPPAPSSTAPSEDAATGSFEPEITAGPTEGATRRQSPTAALLTSDQQSTAHASPSVRKLARQLGVDLGQVSGSGSHERILRADVERYVKQRLAAPPSAAGGAGIEPVPDVDFSRFGPIEEQPLSRIRRASASNLHRAWLNVPHVTQFDEADITELDAFRRSLKDEAAARGVKVTVLAFLMQAVAGALHDHPDLRSSWHSSGEKLIVKNHYHLGIAVDTANGLVVPVVRDVDQKGLFELAAELGEISERARAGKLAIAELQGAVFSISSLGGIGGTGFTPIVNAPEVAILGVSRSKWQPTWTGAEFVPRLMLPFSVSYDHRVVDGAEAVRFTATLARLLGDVRRLLL